MAKSSRALFATRYSLFATRYSPNGESPLSKLSLTFACGLYDRMIALRTGEVQPEGIDLDFITIDNPREMFDRMVGKLEFDASEMSRAEYVSRYAAGA